MPDKPHTEQLGRWQLKDFAHGEGRAEHGTDSGWIDVTAPGDTYVALIEAGRIPHPFRGRHESDVEWVRDREWWWRTTFEAPPPVIPGERIRLVFEGLDTFAAIYLDGELLGRADNMFRTYAFDITGKLSVEGEHDLAICFSPPAQAVPPSNFRAWGAFTDRIARSRRNLMRKAQFGWGWDWGPDLPTVGVWQPVRLERRFRATIAGINFTTLAISADTASVRATVDAEPVYELAPLSATIALMDPDGVTVVTETVAATGGAVLDLAIPAPRLWWTADLGAQPLYTLKVSLFADDVLVDEQTRRVGIRTIRLDTSDDPDEPGTSFFRFILNGVSIFAKGACWIPATSFVGDIDAARYRGLLDQAVSGNMNMIRIWGGGIYEPDLFYDLCDELGLLVWQDFMFACAPYPEDDPAFVDSVRREIEDQVMRLRGHACIALWCGNNENQVMHEFNAWTSGDTTPLPGLLYYDEIIPAVLARLDPVIPYWPGSPWGGPSPNSMRAGDVHNWTVWHGVPPVPDGVPIGGFNPSPESVAYTRYAEDKARFVSEFGIQAAPAIATLRRWMQPEDLVLGSPGFLGRVKDKPAKANAIMLPVTGVPQTLEDYVDFSMWTQAEGMKFAIEHYRRRTPHCAGALIWQFNDCWPCISWSLIDYDGVAKASYYASKRAFAPVLASFKALDDGGIEIWITNDTLAPVSGQAAVEAAGQTDWRAEFAFEMAANSSGPVWRGEAPAGAILSVRSPEGLFHPNRHLPAPISQMKLTQGAWPSIAVIQAGASELRVELSADDFLAFVHLTSDRPDLRFSDNYFDMMPGEKRAIVVRAPGGLGADAIAVHCWNERAAP